MDDTLHEQLEIIATAQGVSESSVVRDALKRFVEEFNNTKQNVAFQELFR